MAVFLWVILVIVLLCIYDVVRDWNKPCAGWGMLPYVGDLPGIVRNWNRLHEWVLEGFAPYPEAGTIFSKRPGMRSWSTQDPANVEHILKTNFENYQVTPLRGERLHDFLGHGIFNADGALWKLQRKTASYEFSNARFREWFLCRFVDHTNHLLKFFESETTPDKVIDMQVKFAELTLGSICHVAFGLDLNNDITVEQKDSFAVSFNTATKLVPMRFLFPMFVTKIFRFFNLPPERQLCRHLAHLKTFVQTIIDQRKKMPEEEIQSQLDLLSRFMIVSAHSEDPYLKSDAFVQDMVMSMLLAGRDTTSNCLSWLFYELTQNPDVEQKVIEEIHSIVGDEPPTFEQLRHMPYLTAVMTETLRKWPSVPIDPKAAVKDDILPSGHHIVAGSLVEILVMVSGRNSKLWPDPNAFKPERFLNEDGEYVKPSPYKAMFFQAGPRLCLGMEMAYLEVKTVAVMILQRYRLRLAPGAVVKPDTDITLPMKYGLKMQVSPAP